LADRAALRSSIGAGTQQDSISNEAAHFGDSEQQAMTGSAAQQDSQVTLGYLHRFIALGTAVA
jgi:hypothetical protein